MMSYGSKLVSEQSVDQLPFRLPSPPKYDLSPRGSHIKNGSKLPLSPVLNKSNTKKQMVNNDSMKLDFGDFSTRRTCTPVKSTIAI